MNDRVFRRAVVGMLAVITTFTLGALLTAAKSVILPFVLALLVAYTFEPVVRRLRRWRVPRWASAALLVGAAFVAIELTVALLGDAAARLNARLPEHLATVQSLLDQLPLPTESIPRLDDPEMWRNLAVQLSGDVGSIAGAVTAAIANASLVLILTVALIIGRARFDQRIDEVAGRATGRAVESAAVLDAIDRGIQRYMLVKAAVSASMGLLTALGLALFGFDQAVLAGFLLMVFNFIPTFGPVIGTVPTVVLILLQYAHAPGLLVGALLVAVGIPVVFTNVIEPKLFGEHLNLNFFAVMLALLFWGFLWGVAGAVIAVPLTLSISLICREVPGLRAVHDLLRA